MAHGMLHASVTRSWGAHAYVHDAMREAPSSRPTSDLLVVFLCTPRLGVDVVCGAACIVCSQHSVSQAAGPQIPPIGAPLRTVELVSEVGPWGCPRVI